MNLREKISIKEAASLLVISIIDKIKIQLEDDKESLLSVKEDLTIDDAIFTYEVYLAVLSMELRAVKNISPELQDPLLDNIKKIMISDDNFGEYSVDSINNVYPKFFSLAERDGSLSIEGALWVLSERLELELTPLIGTALMSVLSSKMGTWRNITSQYTIDLLMSDNEMDSGYNNEEVAISNQQLEAIDKEKTKPFYYGFGGWLYLVAINIIFIFGNSFFALLSDYIPLYQSGKVAMIFETSPVFGFFLFLETLMIMFYIVFPLWIGYLCLKNKKTFPKAVIIFISTRLIFAIITYFAVLSTPETIDLVDSQVGELLYSFIYAVVWIPYFIKSKRVKNTYVH